MERSYHTVLTFHDHLVADTCQVHISSQILDLHDLTILEYQVNLRCVWRGVQGKPYQQVFHFTIFIWVAKHFFLVKYKFKNLISKHYIGEPTIIFLLVIVTYQNSLYKHQIKIIPGHLLV